MNILGVKFAPLNIPLKRRLETLSALFWITLLVFGALISTCILIYIILFTRLYLLGLVYIMWIYLDRNICHQGGRKSNFCRNLICWKYFKDFFPLKIVKTSELPPTTNYLFCSYPHGLLSAGICGHFGTAVTDFPNLFPGLKTHVATLNVHFNAPFTREFLLGLGFVSSSKESIKYILNMEDKGHALALVVGGAAEALYARPGSNRIVLKNRKGFVKLALKTGCPLVPMYTFGENDLYDQVSNPPGSLTYKIQNWLKNQTGIAPCIPNGRGVLQYSFGPVPRRCPVITVVMPSYTEITLLSEKHPSRHISFRNFSNWNVSNEGNILLRYLISIQAYSESLKSLLYFPSEPADVNAYWTQIIEEPFELTISSTC